MQQNESKKLEHIIGQLERVTYHNEETGYAVLRVKVKGYRDLVTAVGNVPSPLPGEVLKLSGEWTSHQKFGEQFKIVFYSCSVPASVSGIERYLGSGLIKGIGPIMAKRIVKVFAEKTLEIIENSVEQLICIPGIGENRVSSIKKSWAEQKEIRSVMLFLQEHGISSAYAAKIYKEYGNDSIQIVKNNPYKLAEDITGIGFIIADKIASNLGFEHESPFRMKAGILHTLHELAEEGHTYSPIGELINKSSELLELPPDNLDAMINELYVEEKVVLEDLNREIGVFLTGYYIAEYQVAKRLLTINSSGRAIGHMNPQQAITDLQAKLSIELADKQVEAVRAALDHKILIITGGPGTGKTTIIKSILTLFSEITDKILLAAPTGRAAKRMTEATGFNAKTIHRLLEYQGKFQKNEENPLECNLIVIDEVSMIDTLLMHHLLKAIPKHAILIMVGDINQLPSIGTGNVLKDMISSGVFKTVELDKVFRQAQTSRIITNAHKIINGKYPNLENDPDSDFYFINEEEPERIVSKIITLVKERVPKKFGYKAITDIQVLSPMVMGTAGVGNLNKELQSALNHSEIEVCRAGRRYLVGDKVMQIKNNYTKQVYNGDIGIIQDINPEDQSVTVNIDGQEVLYEYAELEELSLAYAISVHKSQGSEYPVVIMPLCMSHYVMLQRNLLYTGLTRGKKLVVLLGSKRALYIAIKNDKTKNRKTRLFNMLIHKNKT